MQKTASVQIERWTWKKKYPVRVRRSRKTFAHDEREVCLLGDVVMLSPCRPLSRHKAHYVCQILQRQPRLSDPPRSLPPVPPHGLVRRLPDYWEDLEPDQLYPVWSMEDAAAWPTFVAPMGGRLPREAAMILGRDINRDN